MFDIKKLQFKCTVNNPQPLSIVEKVIFDYRVHGMTVFLQRAHKRVKGLAEKETWKIQVFSDYGAITDLVSEL